MTSRTTRRFRDCFALLSKDVQQQARDAYRRFKRDPHLPGLRFKRVHTQEPIYSVRITRNHRALGVLDADEIVWFWIGSHKEYEEILDEMG